MASIASEVAPPSADIVGNAFVHQYYHILHQSPELVHRFYQDVSKLGRPEGNGMMGTTTTMHAINEKILSLDYGGLSAAITTIDAQDSHDGGVLVLVTGYLTGKDNMKRKFTQSFFLAPQDEGYFVLNDVFRYVDEIYQNGNWDLTSQVEAPLATEQVTDKNVSQEMAPAEEVNDVEVHNSLEDENVPMEGETPIPEVVAEVPDESQMIAESSSKSFEVPKKSYASIVKFPKQNNVPSPAPSHSPMISSVKNHDPPETVVPPPIAQPQAAELDAQISALNVTNNGNDQDAEAECLSIYVKGLPLNSTPSMLENEFKKFGTIKSGGIQVRCQKGSCFGFVEFEASSAVQSAIEASPIVIGGRNVVVEEKHSTYRGNYRVRSSSGAGSGYRNEVGRGRGNYGGNRGYSRGEFSDRAELGNRNGRRGGFANRGGDGYQRGDRPGSSGGRVNHSGGPGMNTATKNAAP